VAAPAIRGIDFILDSSGRKKVVQTDLRLHGELPEDLCDRLIAEQRRSEPRESLADVQRKLASSRRRRRA
jgi:hypothetical protein